MKKYLPILFLFIATFSWSLDTLIRYPLLGKGVSVTQIVLWEHVFLAILFLPFIKGLIKKLNKKSIFPLLFIGILGSAGGTICFTKAMSLINPSVVILLQKLQPIVAVLLARIYLKEELGPLYFLCFFITFSGALLLSFKEISSINWVTQTYNLKGICYSLLAVLAWGGSTVFGKKLLSLGLSNGDILSGRFLFGLIGISFYYLSFVTSSYRPVNKDLLKILMMAILSGVIGTRFYYSGLRKILAQTATLVELSFPFFAVIVNWFFLNIPLSNTQIVGGILISIGPIFLRYKRKIDD